MNKKKVAKETSDRDAAASSKKVTNSRQKKIAKIQKSKKDDVTKNEPLRELTLALNHPGLTPMLRAGLGGLASALREILSIDSPTSKWPAPVRIADGEAIVEPGEVRLKFGPKGPVAFFRELLKRSFAIEKPGVIRLAGTIPSNGEWPAVLAAAQQRAYKRTFLQHGSTTKPAEKKKILQFDDGESVHRLELTPFVSFAHQASAMKLIEEAIDSNSVRLAGWVYPGASQRHVGFPATTCDYHVVEAIAGLFAIIGTVSLIGAGGRGVLVIPVPVDLLKFAKKRPVLSPRKVSDVTVTGAGDAVLHVQLGLHMADRRSDGTGVGALHAVLFKTLAWAKQQKSRSYTVTLDELSLSELQQYEAIVHSLEHRIVARSDEDELDDGDDYFIATSALRGFVTENIANRRKWYHRFAVATVGEKKPRFIHYYRERDGLGALYQEERKGLIAMEKYLEDHELALVRSVHIALRQRFAQIAEDSSDVKATMVNRFDGEREKWRLAFSGSKTLDQIRAALADLWSRAGSNKELQENWQKVLPLLREPNWQAARDLALVALASYRSAKGEQQLNDVKE